MPLGRLRIRKREILAAALLLLPPFLLMPLGALWLWQQGRGLWFFALCLIAAMPAGLFVLSRRRTPAAADLGLLAPAEPDWPAREREAFEKVRGIAASAEPLSFASPDAALALARRTVTEVARHYRPDEDNPLASFTMPEGLALVQCVSARLREAVLDMVPLADRLTLAQLIAAQETIGKAMPLAALGRDLYDLYRAVRPVINPAGAALGEARRAIFDAAWDRSKARLQLRLTQLLVLEAGKAAIELYSGRLRRDAAALARLADAEARAGAAPEGATPLPLRILIAGQTNAGKSSLLNALAEDILAPVSPLPGPPGFRSFEATDPEGRRFVFVDAPGLDSAPGLPSADRAIAALSEEATKADIVLWTLAAHRPARAADGEGINRFRAWFQLRPDLNPPPLLAVATHIDQLSPFAEWAPPYDILAAERPKARAIRQAVEAVASELVLDRGMIVPVSLAPGRAPYNIDALRVRIAAILPAARYAQLARTHAAPLERGWWKELGRAIEAGRTLFTPRDGT